MLAVEFEYVGVHAEDQDVVGYLKLGFEFAAVAVFDFHFVPHLFESVVQFRGHFVKRLFERVEYGERVVEYLLVEGGLAADFAEDGGVHRRTRITVHRF